MPRKPKTGPWRVIKEATAWELIGHEDTVRIKGGKAIYDSVDHFHGTQTTNRVRLARLGNYRGTRSYGLEQHNRWVGPDTVIEVLAPAEQPNGKT